MRARLFGGTSSMPKKPAKRAWTKDDVRTLKTLAREKTKTTAPLRASQ